MSGSPDSHQPLPREASKLISCVIADDGTDKRLLRALRADKNITRALSVSCLGIAVLADAKTKPGHLPKPSLVRLVQVVTTETEADAVFDYIYEKAEIGRPDGGTIWQVALASSTPFTLPEGVEDESH